MANKKLNSIVWPNMPNDTYYLDAEKVKYDASETYPDGSVGKALQNKAEVDGSYESMTVGNAEQLVSNVRVNDQTPYIFRTSGGSVDIGDREYVNGIVGGTVAWNQLVSTYKPTGSYSSNGLTLTNNGTSVSITGEVTTAISFDAALATEQDITFKRDGRKYLILLSKPIPFQAGVGGYNPVVPANALGGIWTTSGGTDWTNGVFIKMPLGSTPNIINLSISVIDLTQMFGSTIADYIYSLEQANAGAGVAWFKKLFPQPYYAYNAGELKSVSGLVSHDMTGFNQWDEEWELGGISSSTGDNATDNTTIRTKNYIKVCPSTTYYLKSGSGGTFNYRFYDANKTYISGTYIGANNTLNIPSGVHYLRFVMGSSYGTTYNHDICINLAWDNSRNGEYEPYELHSYPLDSDLTLRGIPKLDANNNLYYDGDVYEADGTVTRRYGVVDLGTLSWGASGGIAGRFAAGTGGAKAKGFKNIVNAKYTVTDAANMPNIDKSIRGSESNSDIVIYDTSMTGYTGAQVATALNGVYIVYELATPTTETADAYTNPQIVNDFGTEEYVIDSDTFAVPVGHDTDYPVNLVAKLEMAPNSPEGNGDYIVRQTNGTNEYVPLVIEDALPTIPSTAGTYKLTVTVADGVDPVLSWEAE